MFVSKELTAEKEQKEKTAADILKETFKRMREAGPSKQDITRNFVAALHDIHRRVIEEPWFGRTIHDVVSHYNQRIGQDGGKGKAPPGDDLPSSQGKGSIHDYNPDAFYGRNQNKEGEQQEAQQQERSRGMER